MFEPMATTGVFAVTAGETVTWSVRGEWIDADITR